MALISAGVSQIIIYVVIALTVLILLGGGFVWWLMKKKRSKKFNFFFYSKDGKRSRVINAIVKIDSENASKKVFYFAEFDSELSIRDPSFEFEGKLYRECMQDPNGDLQYVERSDIDNKKLELAILPEEKALALYRFKENQRRYDNPLNKATAGLLIGGFILVFLIMLGVIYSTIAFGNSAVKQVETAKVNHEVAQTNLAVAETNRDIVEQLVTVAALLTNNKSVTRILS